MRRMLPLVLVAALLPTAGCGSSSDLSRAETQKQFGVRMAKMNLWREAMFRFRRAAEIDPSDAMAHNNLAVAMEANGDFDGAAKEYREAMRLDRSNQYIQKNYSRLVEFTQRSRKREEKPVAGAAASAATAPAAVQSAPAAAPPATSEPPVGTPPPPTGSVPPPTEPVPPVTEPLPPATEPVPPATETAPPPPPADPAPVTPAPPSNPSLGGAA